MIPVFLKLYIEWLHKQGNKVSLQTGSASKYANLFAAVSIVLLNSKKVYL
jgi:hypothetical protein